MSRNPARRRRATRRAPVERLSVGTDTLAGLTLVTRERKNPPHWFLEKVVDDEVSAAVLQKGSSKGLRVQRWVLLIKGLAPLFFPTRRSALIFFDLHADELRYVEGLNHPVELPPFKQRVPEEAGDNSGQASDSGVEKVVAE